MSTPIETVPASVAAFIGASAGPSAPSRVTSWSEFLTTWPDATALATAVGEFFRNGGQIAWVSPVARVTASAVRRAVEALHPDVSIVVIAADPAARPAVVSAAAEALQGRSALLLIEPRWASVKAAREALAAGVAVALGATGRDVVAYWPRLRRKGALAPVSPLGAVAGVIARTDTTIGYWRAPAGDHAALQGSLSPAIALTDADTELLTPHGINTIRSFPGRGTLIWGARTTSPDPEWRYVSARRLILTLTESIRRGLQRCDRVSAGSLSARSTRRHDPRGRLLRAVRSRHDDPGRYRGRHARRDFRIRSARPRRVHRAGSAVADRRLTRTWIA